MKRTGECKKKVLYWFLMPILILMLVFGLIIADNNIKKVEFGDTVPLIKFVSNEQNKKYGVELNLFGSVYLLDFSPYYYFSVNLANNVVNTIESLKEYANPPAK
jgi:hypothetical protein